MANISSPQENKDAEEKPQKQENQENEVDAELQISSEQFNPLRALYADLRVSKKQPKIIYQNLAAFESAFKKFGIWNLNKRKKTVGSDDKQPKDSPSTSGASTSRANARKEQYDEEVQQRRFLPHQMAIQSTRADKEKLRRNIFHQMESMTGPLGQLQKCVKEHLLVRVSMRREHGIRGTAEGYLICFDKHWNLLMTDVQEVWQRRKYKYGENKFCGTPQDCSRQLRALGIKLPQQEVKSINRKTVEIRRQLRQLLVRGEQVVIVVSKKAPEQQESSKIAKQNENQ